MHYHGDVAIVFHDEGHFHRAIGEALGNEMNNVTVDALVLEADLAGGQRTPPSTIYFLRAAKGGAKASPPHPPQTHTQPLALPNGHAHTHVHCRDFEREAPPPRPHAAH